MPLGDGLADEIRQLSAAIDNLSRASGGGRPFGGSVPSGGGAGVKPTSLIDTARGKIGDLAAGRAFGGGVAGLAGAAGLAAAGTAAAVGATAIGGGLVNQSRGGSFGGGAATALNKLAAGIPVLGELTGAAPTARIQQGTLGDLNSLTNEVARFGGADAISQETRSFLADTLTAQNRNVEADRQRNQAATADRIGAAAEGTGIGRLIESLDTLSSALRGGGNLGPSQHGA